MKLFNKNKPLTPVEKEQYRLGLAVKAGCDAISDCLGESERHEESFVVVLALASKVCGGNGHLTPGEKMRNVQAFCLALIEEAVESASETSDQSMPTQRLM